MARKMVTEAHGGRIFVELTYQPGLFLPWKFKVPAKLLIIDDESLSLPGCFRIAPQDLFEKVFVAQPGAAGIEAARELQPDVILLDLMMPGLSGWETCRGYPRLQPGSDFSLVSALQLTFR